MGIRYSARVSRRTAGRGGDVRSAYLRSVRLLRDGVESFEVYPFSIPAVRELEELTFDPKVTVLVGDNGTVSSARNF